MRLAFFYLALASLVSADMGIWVAGEALLWRTTFADPYYAVVGAASATRPSGDRIDLAARYEWGFRTGIGVRTHEADVRLSWARLRTTQGSKVGATVDQAIWTTDEPPLQLAQGTARGRLASDYDAVDAELGACLSFEQGMIGMRLFLGGRYGRIELCQEAHYLDRAGVLQRYSRQRSRCEGAGPRGGFELSLAPLGGITIGGVAAAAVLLGTIRGSTAQIDNPRLTTLLPVFDWRIFGSWYRRICSQPVEAEVGYEVATYRGAFQTSTASQVHAGAVSLDGAYVRLEVGF